MNTAEKWITILGEEFGEACNAILENETKQIVIDELIQIAAVAINMALHIQKDNYKTLE